MSGREASEEEIVKVEAELAAYKMFPPRYRGPMQQLDFVKWLTLRMEEAKRYQGYFEGVEEAKEEHYYRGMMHAYKNVLERVKESE